MSVKNFKCNKTDDAIVNFKKNNKLPNNYIFYPAMYLSHKNHKYIIDVLYILNNNQKLDISAVFCGSDKGYLKNLKEYSMKKNLSDKIKFLDFVKDEELPYLYINSLALAMPTLIGPTNIPPWEAFKLNIPAIDIITAGVLESPVALIALLPTMGITINGTVVYQITM